MIELVSRYDVLVYFFAIDMATHGDEVVGEFKNGQAARVTANLTPEHHPNMVKQLEELATAIRRMPNQLFLQAFLMIKLVLKVIQESTLYYVQRLPAELGNIAWIIDRKDQTITEMENTWSTLILPMSESHFVKEPLACLEGADYSYFDERYGINVNDEEMRSHLEWMRKAYGIRNQDLAADLNATLLLSEQRDFADSSSSLGLQLADMLAGILRRALNNRLQQSGWKDFGRLIVAENSTPLVQLGSPEGSEPPLQAQVQQVWRALKTGNKSMLP